MTLVYNNAYDRNYLNLSDASCIAPRTYAARAEILS